MEDNKKGGLYDDSFWDLSTYKKQKPSGTPMRRTAATIVTATEISLPKKPADTQGAAQNAQPGAAYKDSAFSSDGTITRFVSPVQKKPNTDRRLLLEYTPKNPLIKEVQIYTDLECDSVFAKDNLFLRERRALLGRVGKEVPHVPFYSMMPRYSQMTRPQLAYYLWWRENIRNGVFLECDVSYVILYAHELIADEESDKQETLNTLCRLYTLQCGNKQAAYFGIGSLISDFCLLYNLTLPDSFLGDKFAEFVAYTALPEFYIDVSDRHNPALHEKIMTAASVYNYKKSKHYPVAPAIFDTHVRGAVASIFENERAYAALSSFSSSAYGEVLTSHKPFFKIPGLTTKQAKIKITYYPLSFLRAPITDAIRYIENRIREHLGIKSKLNVTTVNPDIKNAIDAYADKFCPPMSRERISLAAEKKAAQEYDKLYDVPKSELSLDRALEIEQKSWETTKILVDAFENSEDMTETVTETVTKPGTVTVAEPQIITSEPVFTQFTDRETRNDETSLLEKFDGLLGDDAEFLSLCIENDFSAQRKFALSHSSTPDEIAERINGVSLELIGDILLEDTGDGYSVLPDYQNLF